MMTTIKKAAVYFLMLILAIIVAGVYGIIHDQISYSFSAEYFTRYKFVQFDIFWANDVPRIGAAYVGLLATWWMGALVFLILGLFGFMFSTPSHMAINLGKSFFIVIAVALISGMLGLLYGYYQVNEQTIDLYTLWLKPGVTDPIQFVRVGFMHNASYAGGLLGMISGVIYLLVLKRRNKIFEISQNNKP